MEGKTRVDVKPHCPNCWRRCAVPAASRLPTVGAARHTCDGDACGAGAPHPHRRGSGEERRITRLVVSIAYGSKVLLLGYVFIAILYRVLLSSSRSSRPARVKTGSRRGHANLMQTRPPPRHYWPGRPLMRRRASGNCARARCLNPQSFVGHMCVRARRGPAARSRLGRCGSSPPHPVAEPLWASTQVSIVHPANVVPSLLCQSALLLCSSSRPIARRPHRKPRLV